MKSSNAFCLSRQVSTSMNKVIGLLVKASKNLYDKKEKHIRWVIIIIKSFFHLNHQRCGHPHQKRATPNTKFVQMGLPMMTSTNVQMPSTNKTMSTASMKRLKRKLQENMDLLPQNMTIGISHSGHKNISNDIMWYNPLPTMDTTKEVDPMEFNEWSKMQCVSPRVKGWKRPNLICKARKIYIWGQTKAWDDKVSR